MLVKAEMGDGINKRGWGKRGGSQLDIITKMERKDPGPNDRKEDIFSYLPGSQPCRGVVRRVEGAWVLIALRAPSRWIAASNIWYMWNKQYLTLSYLPR